MFGDFKQAMIKEFEIADIDHMTYYLGIKIKQGEDEIFVSQNMFVKEILQIQDKGLWKSEYFNWVWSEDVKEWWKGEDKLYNIQKSS